YVAGIGRGRTRRGDRTLGAADQPLSAADRAHHASAQAVAGAVRRPLGQAPDAAALRQGFLRSARSPPARGRSGLATETSKGAAGLAAHVNECMPSGYRSACMSGKKRNSGVHRSREWERGPMVTRRALVNGALGVGASLALTHKRPSVAAAVSPIDRNKA